MDVQEIIKKVTSDKNLAGKLLKDPAGTVKEVAGVDLPADQVNKIVAAVKDKGLGMLDSDGDGKPDLGALGNLGGLFKK